MTPQADHGEPSYKGTGRLARLPSLSRERESMLPSPIYPKRRTPGIPTSCYRSRSQSRPSAWRHWPAARIETVARKAIDALGSIDLLVNNAAFQRTHEKFEDIPEDEFEEAYRVNEIQRRWRASGVFFGRV